MKSRLATVALLLVLAGCQKAPSANGTDNADAAAAAHPAASASATPAPADALDESAADGASAAATDKYAAGSTADIAVLGDASSWAAGKDCQPMGSLPTYEAGKPERRSFEHAEFIVQPQPEGESRTYDIAGRYCSVSYTPKEGTQELSDLEIQSNYRDQLGKLGAEILSKDDRNTYAMFNRQGVQTWVHVYSQETEIDVTVIDRQPFKSAMLAPGGNDYPLLGHLPGYAAGTPEKRNFDQTEFDVDTGDGASTVTVQGAKYVVGYEPTSAADTRSDLDIQSNYRDALKRLGAQIVHTDDRNTTARFAHDGRAVWVKVYSQETGIDVSVIEEKPFQASLTPPKADALKAALDKDGHVALYINFDFDKATLRPDAAPVIAQVATLLRDNPTLKLSVEGNTDSIGGHDYNTKLSRDRAAAVVAALVAGGIAEDRLRSVGNGPDRPIADNDSAEGRAKNRRVELVRL